MASGAKTKIQGENSRKYIANYMRFAKTTGFFQVVGFSIWTIQTPNLPFDGHFSTSFGCFSLAKVEATKEDSESAEIYGHSYVTPRLLKKTLSRLHPL